jgi:hypothetical protein
MNILEHNDVGMTKHMGSRRFNGSREDYFETGLRLAQRRRKDAPMNTVVRNVDE